MQLPGAKASSETHNAYADYVEDAAEAWAEVPILTEAQKAVIKEVATEVNAADETLRARVEDTRKAGRKARKCRTRYSVCDVILDKAVMGFHDAVYNGPALRNRRHPILIALFRDQTAGQITRANMYEEPKIVKRLIERADKQPDFPGKKAARDTLAAAVDVSLTQRDVMDDADLAENQAVDAELAARLALRTVLEQAYGKLRAAFPGQRDFVESFFPKQSRSRTAASAGEDSAATDAEEEDPTEDQDAKGQDTKEEPKEEGEK